MNGFGQDASIINNLQPDKGIETSLNTMTTVQQIKNSRIPPAGAGKPFGRQNRNILNRNKTKRV